MEEHDHEPAICRTRRAPSKRRRRRGACAGSRTGMSGRRRCGSGRMRGPRTCRSTPLARPKTVEDHLAALATAAEAAKTVRNNAPVGGQWCAVVRKHVRGQPLGGFSPTATATRRGQGARRLMSCPLPIACRVTTPPGRCCLAWRGCDARRPATRVRDGRGAAPAHGGPGPRLGVGRLAGSGGACGGTKPGPGSNRWLDASCSPGCRTRFLCSAGACRAVTARLDEQG